MKKILPIIVIVVIIGVGAWAYLSGGKLSFSPGGVSINKTITTKSETFTGDLKAALAKGGEYKCTCKMNDTESTAYLKEGKYYGEVTKSGKQAYIILIGKCIWTWDKGGTKGVKMCLEGDLLEQQGAANQACSCKSDSFSDSLFNPPANVNFLDMDKNMGVEE